MQPRILLFGPPGAGKETQGIRIAERLQVPFLSTGGLCRTEVSRNTDLAEYISCYMSRGMIVPGVAGELVREQLLQRGLLQTGYVLDGYCRTLPTLHDFLLWGQPTHVVHLSIPDELVRGRLRSRNREDDHEEAIQRRLQHYHEFEEKVCDYIRNSTDIPFCAIDGAQEIDHVTSDILAFLGQPV